MTRVIEYALRGAGWAEGTLLLDDRRLELDASYIHDTFKEIVEALLSACKGQETVEWVYFHEPESTHVYLTRANGGQAIAVRRYPDFRIPRPRLGYAGTLIAEAKVQLRQVVADVIIAGSRMIDAHGEQGYLQSWHHSFPTSAFADLRQLRRNSALL